MRMNPALQAFVGVFALAASATPIAAQQSDNEAISAADRTFYAALSSRDLRGMEAVWARKPYVSVVGPRSRTRTLGYEAVVKYWADAFASFSKMSAQPANTQIQTDGKLAWVVGNEVAELQPESGAPLKFETFVTHVFEKDGDRWLLVSHHAQMVPK